MHYAGDAPVLMNGPGEDNTAAESLVARCFCMFMQAECSYFASFFGTCWLFIIFLDADRFHQTVILIHMHAAGRLRQLYYMCCMPLGVQHRLLLGVNLSLGFLAVSTDAAERLQSVVRVPVVMHRLH